MTDAVVAAVAAAQRRDRPRVFATTARLTRDLDLAEECTQEAFAQALESWPWTGIPDRPAAWLTAVARNPALDALRRESALHRRMPLLVADDPAPGPRPASRTSASA
jgi:RNA polymerase sigma-70 factor (ECF subfamily)